ncbi:MAG TPA: hypothetical protein VF814_06045 [Casimicrobiaceae bacterium]
MKAMIEQRAIAPGADAVHLSFNEHRQPILRGAGRRYLLARGDQLAFAAEVVRFGFAPDDFALEIDRVRGNRAGAAGGPTFTVTVEHIRNERSATYLGGPGRSWVAEFLMALIAGEFGQP